MVSYPICQLLIVGFDMWSRKIVEYDDADEDANETSRETKDSRYDTDGLENHRDSSSP
jgi:hypothetical protein